MDVLGLIFGGVGAVAGIAALLYAHAAFRGGRDSGQLAIEANKLAKGSNTIALDARRIAMDANEYSHRAEQRETEPHDVHWEGDWIQPGTYRLVKCGDDTAHNVKATVSYDNETVTQEANVMTKAGEALEFDFPTAAADYRQEVRKHVYTLGGAREVAYDHQFEQHSLAHRVVWTTALGTPQKQAPEFPALVTFTRFISD